MLLWLHLHLAAVRNPYLSLSRIDYTKPHTICHELVTWLYWQILHAPLRQVCFTTVINLDLQMWYKHN